MHNLLLDIRNCISCLAHLNHGSNPIVQAHESAKILIIGQAPGMRAHMSSIPWNDRSGDRLRNWLNLDKSIFYDERKIAIVPMGFCFPGVDNNGSDKPPRKECAPKWHKLLINKLPNIELTLLVGSYAQNYYLKDIKKETMTNTVRSWKEYLPHFFPIPHPSWRNTGWLKSNTWFNQELLPDLQNRINNLAVDMIAINHEQDQDY